MGARALDTHQVHATCTDQAREGCAHCRGIGNGQLSQRSQPVKGQQAGCARECVALPRAQKFASSLRAPSWGSQTGTICAIHVHMPWPGPCTGDKREPTLLQANWQAPLAARGAGEPSTSMLLSGYEKEHSSRWQGPGRVRLAQGWAAGAETPPHLASTSPEASPSFPLVADPREHPGGRSCRLASRGTVGLSTTDVRAMDTLPLAFRAEDLLSARAKLW